MTQAHLGSQPSLEGPSPQLIHISRKVRQSDKVNDISGQALGPVIFVPRHGRNEYVIDHRYAHQILTDSKNITFEKAVFELLHFVFIALFDNGSFVHDFKSLPSRERRAYSRA